jgi:hypothetical protein
MSASAKIAKRLTSSRFDSASDAVEHFLGESLGAGALAEVPEDAIEAYRDLGCPFVKGWGFQCDFDGAIIGLRVLLGEDFPFGVPRIGIAEPHEVRGAHIERGSLLCLPPGQVVAWDRPADALGELLAQAEDVIASALAGDGGAEDTRREIIAYWARDPTHRTVGGFLDPARGSRRIFRFDHGKCIQLFDNRGSAKDFIESGGGELKPTQFGKAAYLVRLIHPPRVTDLPKDVGDLARLLLDQGDADLDQLARLLAQEKVTVVLAFADENGHGFIGVEVPKLGYQRGAPVLLPFITAHDKEKPIGRLRILRGDADWVFGRDGNPDVAALQTKSVILIGAGSLGSYVAQQLASSGVGAIKIVDPEILMFENISRHILGAEAIGAFKAEALALRLQRQFRTSVIRGRAIRWQEWIASEANALRDADLVVTTIGDWAQEVHLADYLQSNPGDAAAMFAWLEPHAIAAHAVMLHGSRPCFCCGFDTQAELERRMSDWYQPTRREVPLCGGHYQPYGAAALSGHAAAISDAAIKFLLGRIEAPAHLLRSAGDPTPLGGSWRDWWREKCGGQDADFRQMLLPWPHNEACPMCASPPC